MAHFAEIWTGSTTGVTISPHHLPGTTGVTYEHHEVVMVLIVPENQEHRGEDFLANDLGLGGKWIQTSYNNNIRKNFAGIGMMYNEEYDFFTYKQPFPSWILNPDSGLWEPPT